jgi:hypothetical protein
MRKTFYEVLWALCEAEGLLTKWKEKGLLIYSHSKYSWSPKVNEVLETEELKIVDSLPVEELKERVPTTVPVKVEPVLKRTPKTFADIPWIEEFAQKFSRQNLGFSGKVTDKKTTLQKMHKFLETYDYTSEEILAATDMYIDSLKRSGSIRFIRNSGYFISKVIDGVQQSDLASWCEEYRSTGNKGNYNSRSII